MNLRSHIEIVAWSDHYKILSRSSHSKFTNLQESMTLPLMAKRGG